jgi:hypothetical protein
MRGLSEKRLEAKVAGMLAKVFVSDGGWFRVYNVETKGSYWVHLESRSCNCQSREDDHYGLGTCKHIEYVREWLRGRNDRYGNCQAIFDSPAQAHSFSSMVLGNKNRFHNVWVELIIGRYVVHYKSNQPKITGRTITQAERPRDMVAPSGPSPQEPALSQSEGSVKGRRRGEALSKAKS